MKYNIPNTLGNTSFSFGQSREKFKKVYLRENPPRDPAVPGPGEYKPVSAFSQREGFSLKSKQDFTSAFYDPKKYVPGPGSYLDSK
jgi:hypothetical protein